MANEQLNVVVVCGVTHGGTSLAAKLLVDAGADPGEYDPSDGEGAPDGWNRYVKYECRQFKWYCANRLNIATDIPTATGVDVRESFRQFLAGLPRDRVWLFKYPKASMMLPELRWLIGPGMRVVYVVRGLEAWLESHKRRAGQTDADEPALVDMYTASYGASRLYWGPLLYVRFEKLLDRGEPGARERQRMLAFAGLAPHIGGLVYERLEA